MNSNFNSALALATFTFFGCSSASSTPAAGARGADAGADASVTAVDSTGADGGILAKGLSLVADNGCRTCHGENLAGTPGGIPGVATVHGANLTPDKDTGIGDWTDEQIAAAIRTGLDDEGQP